MKQFILCSILFLCFLFANAQKVTISGYVTDIETGEGLINANVFENQRNEGTISNAYGFYSLTIQPGQMHLQYSFVGYHSQVLDLDLRKDTILNIKLQLQPELDEVTVYANKSNIERSQMSMVELPTEKLDKLPVLLGEPDVLKVIQLLPGVQSGSEGTSGIYVRGGGPDQNLFLLDGVPVYNASHLFGFFSVFNPAAVKTVTLYKGGFPARFGGRLSSVIDIRMKEGNDQEFKGEFSIGLISSRFSIEGPIKKGKTSFIFSGRRTYADVLAQPIILFANRNDEYGKTTGGYYFYDINAKINHKFSANSRLYFSVYAGRDRAYASDSYKVNWENKNYSEKDKMGIGWGNITSALRWNYVFSPKLFSNVTLTYSSYNFDVSEDYRFEDKMNNTTSQDYFRYLSGIHDLTAKWDFDYYPGGGHEVKFGVSNIWHQFKPGVNHERTIGDLGEKYPGERDTTYGNTNISAIEMEAYIEDNYDITSKLKANLGLHFSLFSVENTNYTSLEPRASLRYLFNDNFSVKASYTKMSQYIHLLSSSTISLPTDLWLPATKNIKPQNSHQIALGMAFKTQRGYDLTIEGFYKTMDNLIEYKEGASFTGVGSNWESKIEMGKGWSYGAEFLFEKKTGKTTGWIGYTLSWANRQFENLNFGKVFPAKYDRRHDISLVATHEFSKKFDIGLVWVYGTGNATTIGKQRYESMLPVSNTYYYGNQDIVYYGERNSYRMPSYHRMDLSMNFHKQKKHGFRTWTFSVYNAYSRQNPFYLYWGSDRVTGYNQEGQYYESYKPALKQVSLFPIIPSISYTYKF